MKKKVLFRLSVLAAVVAMTVSIDSCANNCKFCKYVEYENGNVINSGSETEYCGADLIKQEAIPDVTVGGITTKVECR